MSGTLWKNKGLKKKDLFLAGCKLVFNESQTSFHFTWIVYVRYIMWQTDKVWRRNS